MADGEKAGNALTRPGGAPTAFDACAVKLAVYFTR